MAGGGSVFLPKVLALNDEHLCFDGLKRVLLGDQSYYPCDPLGVALGESLAAEASMAFEMLTAPGSWGTAAGFGCSKAKILPWFCDRMFFFNDFQPSEKPFVGLLLF